MTRAFAASLCAVVLFLAAPSAQQPTPPAGAARAELPAQPSRHAEEGRPLVRSYRPFEVGGGTQTWALVQDARGVIYAATNAAVLEFDGASWRRITVTLTGSVRALAIDATGRIYVGGARRSAISNPTLPARCIRLAARSIAGKHTRLQRGLACLLPCRRRLVSVRERPLPLGQQLDDGSAGDVAVQPVVLCRRQDLRPDARVWIDRARRLDAQSAAGHRAIEGRAVSGRLALRRQAAAHRHAPRRFLHLRRRDAHQVRHGVRRPVRDHPGVPRHAAARWVVRDHDDQCRILHHGPAGATGSSASIAPAA